MTDAELALEHPHRRAEEVGPLWRRRWVRQMAAYLAVSIGFGVTLFIDQRQDDVACEDRQDGREALRQAVTEAFRPSVGGVDFSEIPTYAGLDEATQRFLDDLGEVLANSDGGTAVRDRILETIPPIEC